MAYLLRQITRADEEDEDGGGSDGTGEALPLWDAETAGDSAGEGAGDPALVLFLPMLVDGETGSGDGQACGRRELCDAGLRKGGSAVDASKIVGVSMESYLNESGAGTPAPVRSCI